MNCLRTRGLIELLILSSFARQLSGFAFRMIEMKDSLRWSVSLIAKKSAVWGSGESKGFGPRLGLVAALWEFCFYLILGAGLVKAVAESTW